MPRSSESVAALGGALAKAQAELINPEKSLVATIPTGRPGAGGGKAEERSFRYASLASGLDIVRKTLSQHEIATVQTTAVEPATGLVNLTTMLLHASGEWIASDWPVCPISDLSSPRRMGAALTYARRYGLFTLVGIAGEDDLDAPDLQDRAVLPPPTATNGTGNGLAGAGVMGAGSSPTRRSGVRGRREHSPLSVLPAAGSAELRDRLFMEIAAIASSEQAEAWAAKALPIKNTLAVADAQTIEQAFERRLIELSAISDAEPPPVRGLERSEVHGEPFAEFGCPPRPNAQPDEPSGPVTQELSPVGTVIEPSGGTSPRPPPGIDKSVLAISEPKRHRNKEHLRFVARQPCLVCGRTPSDPHHLRFAQPRALGRKVSDEFAVPLCRSHHRALHRVGNEQGWWQTAGIDALKVARQLWGQSRLIEQVEGTDAPAARSRSLSQTADTQSGTVPPSQRTSQIARRDPPRIKHRGVRAPADGRLPSR